MPLLVSTLCYCKPQSSGSLGSCCSPLPLFSLCWPLARNFLPTQPVLLQLFLTHTHDYDVISEKQLPRHFPRERFTDGTQYHNKEERAQSRTLVQTNNWCSIICVMQIFEHACVNAYKQSISAVINNDYMLLCHANAAICNTSRSRVCMTMPYANTWH